MRLLVEICRADTVYPIIREVLEASRCEGVCPCPPSNHTSSSPSGSSSVPCCPKENRITLWAAIGLAYPIGWSSRSSSRYWSSAVLTGGSPTGRARPRRSGADAMSGSRLVLWKPSKTWCVKPTIELLVARSGRCGGRLLHHEGSVWRRESRQEPRGSRETRPQALDHGGC